MSDFINFITPDEIEIWQAMLMIFLSLLGSAITAAFSIGGGLILIAAMTIIFPAPAVVPVHGGIMIGSNIGRSVLLRQFIRWEIWIWFLLGAAIGGLVGSQIAVGLPAHILRFAIAFFILFTQWGPKLPSIGKGANAIGFTLTGAISTVLTMFVGATGPFTTTAVAQVEKIQRQELVATVGACMSLQHTIKVLVFTIGGFIYAPWLPFIMACVGAGFIGTMIGTRILKRINEDIFKKIFKYILTAMAFYLVYLGFAAIL